MASELRDAAHVLPLTALVLVLLCVALALRRQGAGPRAAVAFFHPQCAAAGGGERVLWVAVRAAQARGPVVVLAARGTPDARVLAADAKRVFGIDVDPERLAVVRLLTAGLVDGASYAFATLLLQAAGMAVAGLEAALRMNASVLVDTVGCVFAYPLWRVLLRTRVVAYIHYPFVVREAAFASHRATHLRRAYYTALWAASSAAYRCAHVLLANSQWTAARVCAPGVRVLSPPCGPRDPIGWRKSETRRRVVVSLAQFRPEKRHREQLDIFADVLQRLRKCDTGARLVLVGGVRNDADRARVAELRRHATSLRIGSHVDFMIGASRAEVASLLRTAAAALHTMRDEHFGIGIVECMAAGALPVAHASGGPLTDIVVRDVCGFLCTTHEDYVAALASILVHPDAPQFSAMREQARVRAASRFSDNAFELGIVQSLF